MAGNTVRKEEFALPIRLLDSKFATESKDIHSPDADGEAGPLSVRTLTAEYIDEILAIERRSFPAPWSRALMLRTLEQKVAFNLGLFEGQETDERLVGYSYNFIVVDELHVLNIAILPDKRGLGFGRLLLTEVLTQAAERGVVYAMLEVRVTNLVAQTLYSSMGFRVGGLRRRYYRDNGEDALVLERRLGSPVSPTDLSTGLPIGRVS